MSDSRSYRQHQIDLKHVLGIRLAALRRDRRVTQIELADSLHVCHSDISKLERGQRYLKASEVPAIAQALGMKPSELSAILNSAVLEFDGRDAEESD